MSKPLRVLIVEDVEEDAQLLLRALGRGGFDVTYERVDTGDAMAHALNAQAWDLVVSDFSMPGFDAMMALDIVKKLKLDLPFIIVSGTVGEDVAVQAIHAGAHDFMGKGKLARLIPAVERELRDAAFRQDRKKLEEQLLVSERMASVGTLAAGVAHEINNPLAALIANLEFASQNAAALATMVNPASAEAGVSSGSTAHTEALADLEQHLRVALECGERVRSIARDLNLFSRADEEATGPVDTRLVIESALRMASNEIRHRARLITEFKDVPPVQGNEGRLGQVFLNLIVNAAQAIPEGDVANNVIRVVTGQADKGRVFVEIHDSGSGIPAPTLARIFEPFYTTKPIGGGTGLGLAICHRIVTAHAGELLVESQVGHGTVFRVLLPVAAQAATAPVQAVQSSGPGRRGRILVVDDEPFMRNIVQKMLSAEHDVLVANGATDALAQISNGAQFDIILSDLMMPGMTGMDLYRELQRLAPGQAEKMAFMTGGAFTPGSREFLEQVPNARIQKPFSLAQVRAFAASLVR